MQRMQKKPGERVPTGLCSENLIPFGPGFQICLSLADHAEEMFPDCALYECFRSACFEQNFYTPVDRLHCGTGANRLGGNCSHDAQLLCKSVSPLLESISNNLGTALIVAEKSMFRQHVGQRAFSCA